MKKIVLGLAATVFLVTSSFGQSNNPYNSVGVDVVYVSKVIYKDFTDGKLKDVNQATLDYYFKTYLPKYTPTTLAQFTQIFSELKNATNKTIIDGAKLSDEAKGFLNKSLTSYSITTLVGDVLKSKLSVAEQEVVLTVLAINYNLVKSNTAFKTTTTTTTKGPNVNYDVTIYPEPFLFSESGGSNAAVWGGLGYIVGSAICGPVCGYVGASLGLVMGGYLDSNPRSGGGGGWNPQP